ncbi:MAG TPA: DUF4349 domain-containing protein [Terracidiphilus sp.]|nr:DUF4349 domain-containing protein [Terracidiphilus sp.]
MNNTTHPVAPEEIMALLDGELSADERQNVTAHLEQCVECAAVRDEFLHTSEAMAQWTVPEPSPGLDRAIEAKVAEGSWMHGSWKPRVHAPGLRNWRPWAVAAAVVLVAVAVAFLASSARLEHKTRHVQFAEERMDERAPFRADGGSAPAPSPAQAGIAGAESAPLPAVAKDKVEAPGGVMGGHFAAPPPPPPAPAATALMIARTVALTIRVKDIAASRAALDGILALHHGYAASLTLNTPEDGPRSFQSSLRIPAPDLQVGLNALRRLGRVETETQSGEEVTQQHADLVARLTNARETEQRLRQLLAERTGKMQDVLDVEEKISETRGEIESMEAAQDLLEHRVAFATVDLQLQEEFKEQLGTGASVSVGTRLRNAFVAGLRNAGGSLLGLILFLEEVGPVLLIWIVILGGPALLVWRRYRRIHG